MQSDQIKGVYRPIAPARRRSDVMRDSTYMRWRQQWLIPRGCENGPSAAHCADEKLLTCPASAT